MGPLPPGPPHHCPKISAGGEPPDPLPLFFCRFMSEISDPDSQVHSFAIDPNYKGNACTCMNSCRKLTVTF